MDSIPLQSGHQKSANHVRHTDARQQWSVERGENEGSGRIGETGIGQRRPPTLAQLIDSNVSQKSGARMGRVVDVLIDSEAQPQALVIDLSDSLAADKRQVAANWPDLHVVSRNKVMQLQLDFTDAQIKVRPNLLARSTDQDHFARRPATGTC